MLVWVAVGRDVAVISALISHPRHEGWKVDSMFVSVHGIGQLKIVVCLQSWLCGGVIILCMNIALYPSHFNYLKQPSLADVSHPCLFALSGTSI